MIPHVEKTATIQSNITGETGEFRVDENALAHIMDVLSKLYSDPEAAVIREYLTNAYDAQIDAGMKPGNNWKQIEIITPSHFNKSYKIRDFGIGMSVDDLKNIYSRYGKSTKTKSNDVVGMLGLGSKCALAYTNSFTITAIKGGVAAQAIISKNDEGIPVFHIVDTRSTNEPDGVEINIPVKDRNSFEQKTNDFLKWWQPGLVLVNGAEPKPHDLSKIETRDITYSINGQDITEPVDIYMVQKALYGSDTTSRIVMGNVAYEVSSERIPINLREAGFGFVAYVPMGAVNFPPSREGLFYNTHTKSVVEQISAGLWSKILEAKMKEVEDQPDYISAWKAWAAAPHVFTKTFSWSNMTYKGHRFVNYITQNTRELTWDYNDRSHINDMKYVYVQNNMSVDLIVTGFTDAKVHPSFRKKILHYLCENDIDNDKVLLVVNDIDSVWFSHIPRIDAETIRDIKVPRTNTTPRGAALYDAYVWDGDVTKYDPVESISTTGRIAYISPVAIRSTRYKYGCSGNELLAKLPKDVTLVVLGNNRWEKFRRNHPTAIPVFEIVKSEVDRLATKGSDMQNLIAQLEESVKRTLRSLTVSDIDDPELVELITAVQSGVTGNDYEKAQALSLFARRYAGITVSVPERQKSNSNPLNDYPLLDGNGYPHPKHVALYCNAVYADRP